MALSSISASSLVILSFLSFCLWFFHQDQKEKSPIFFKTGGPAELFSPKGPLFFHRGVPTRLADALSYITLNGLDGGYYIRSPFANQWDTAKNLKKQPTTCLLLPQVTTYHHHQLPPKTTKRNKPIIMNTRHPIAVEHPSSSPTELLFCRRLVLRQADVEGLDSSQPSSSKPSSVLPS